MDWSSIFDQCLLRLFVLRDSNFNVTSSFLLSMWLIFFFVYVTIFFPSSKHPTQNWGSIACHLSYHVPPTQPDPERFFWAIFAAMDMNTNTSLIFNDITAAVICIFHLFFHMTMSATTKEHYWQDDHHQMPSPHTSHPSPKTDTNLYCKAIALCVTATGKMMPGNKYPKSGSNWETPHKYSS